MSRIFTLTGLAAFILVGVLFVACSKGEKAKNGDAKTNLALTAKSGAFLYSVTDLGTLGGAASEAFSLNNAGQVVGSADTSRISQTWGSVAHAFLWQGGRLMDLGVLGGDVRSEATGINNRGTVVGSSTKLVGDIVLSQPFVYRGGRMSLLETGDKRQSVVSSINDAGHYAGLCKVSGAIHAYLHDGTLHDLGTLQDGKGRSEAYAINNYDEVVGVSWTSNMGDTRAFVWQKGKMVNLGILPGHYRSEAHGINNKTQIVGWSALPYSVNPDPRAFLYSDGTMVDLNQRIPSNSGWVLLKANGINDAGQIVGAGLHNGKRHAFLLSPARK